MLLFSQLQIFGKSDYSSEDLKILHKDNSASEFINHYKDIPPSKRDSQWQKMTQDMAALYVKNFITNLEISRVNFQKITRLLDETFLLSNEYFQYQVSKFAIKYFEKCAPENDCKNEIALFINKSKRFSELDYELYSVIKMRQKESGFDLLEFLITSKSSELYCKKEELYIEIKNLIFQRISLNDSHESSLDKVTLLNKEGCLNILKPKLYTEALQEKDNLKREVIFKTLKATQKLDASEEYALLTSYLLFIPQIGDTFNLAFTRLETLSQNFEQRKKLLALFQSQNFLPDDIVQDSDETRRDIIISKFTKNFPEYFTHYAKECIHFYKGDKVYQSGNPTKNCDKFIELAKSRNWISELILKEYDRARKI